MFQITCQLAYLNICALDWKGAIEIAFIQLANGSAEVQLRAEKLSEEVEGDEGVYQKPTTTIRFKTHWYKCRSGESQCIYRVWDKYEW